MSIFLPEVCLQLKVTGLYRHTVNTILQLYTDHNNGKLIMHGMVMPCVSSNDSMMKATMVAGCLTKAEGLQMPEMKGWGRKRSGNKQKGV